ncbi:hypothetical protein CDL15_Pgr013995 [Punica granatum]|uniref:Uncharacterized protein n=1 Tax=Punica granatum TaxID=22663 RepID=A0A218W9L0_PUNGR|nr:hypothetical protein CDL15_Pgr013995 [Punica granatum]
MKESVRELESSLRRIGVDSCSVKEIESYLTLRKKMKRLILNCFEALMKMKKQNILDQDSQDEATLNILRDVERMSISVFETLPSSSFGAKEHLDLELLLVLKSSKASNVQVNYRQTQAEALQSSVKEIEEASESIFRCLVKARVSLLNSLNH